MSWEISIEEKKHFDRLRDSSLIEGKPMVLWGWKRDRVLHGVRFPESRTVYFSADLSENNGHVNISRAFFFLETRAVSEEILALQNQIETARKVGLYDINVFVWKDSVFKEYSRLRMEVGVSTSYDEKIISRRLKGKPRLAIPSPMLVKEVDNYDLSSFAPFALCVGSGLSAESGLPLLGSIHNVFEVDNMDTRELVFGEADGLPKCIAEDVDGSFRDFCQFTIDAIKAQPSKSHFLISELYKKGVITEVFTDNMDDILHKVGVPYTRTRLSIFPDRFPVKFKKNVKSLLVVGVAVDRRDVIKQARAAGLKIIAINPVYGVAPHSRNMDYLRHGDIFFREKANVALPKIIKESGFSIPSKSLEHVQVAYGI